MDRRRALIAGTFALAATAALALVATAFAARPDEPSAAAGPPLYPDLYTYVPANGNIHLQFAVVSGRNVVRFDNASRAALTRSLPS